MKDGGEKSELPVKDQCMTPARRPLSVVLARDLHESAFFGHIFSPSSFVESHLIIRGWVGRFASNFDLVCTKCPYLLLE